MIRLRALLVALAASFAVLLLGSVPRAEAVITNATLSEPPDQHSYPVPRIPLSGTFTADRGTKQINVGVRRDIPGAPTATFQITNDRFDSQGRFNFETSPDFAYNGRYLVDAVFVNDDSRDPVFGGCGRNPCTHQESRVVFLAAPPAPPTKVAAAYDDAGRKVTLTWNEAPEPDTIGWGIRRSVDGGPQGDESSVLASKTPTFVDSALPDAGGKVEYSITTYRKGATDQTSVNSTPVVKPVTVSARPPDAPPTTVAPGGTTTTTSPFGAVVTAPPATVKGRPRLSGNVGDFAKGLNGAPGGKTRSTLADGTYEETLPYGEQGEELEPGDGEAQVFANTPGDAANPLSAVFFVAAAALASVIAAHVLFLLRQVKRADPAFADLAMGLPPVESSPPAAEAAPEPVRAEPDADPAPPEPQPMPPKRVPRKVR